MSGTRLTLRVLSVLLSVALVALGVIVVAEIVLAALDRPAWVLPHGEIATTLQEQTWDSVLARVVAAGLCLVGLLLLLPALRRGRPSALPLAARTEHVDAAVHRRGLQTTVSAAAARVDGVRRARAQVGRRTVKVRADSRLRDTSGLREQVEAAVRSELDALSLRRPLAVRVKTSGRT